MYRKRCNGLGLTFSSWLALLLGRYRLDVPSCIAVYMEMATAIDPQMCGPPSRPKRRAYRLDQSELITKVKQVLRRYGLKEELLEDGVWDDALRAKVRCKHV